MACDSGKTSTKKKIIIFSSIGIVISIAMYFAFTTTNNPAIAAALPLLSFAVCPLMCAAVGGLMWFSRRSSKSNDNHEDSHNKPITTNTKEEACCSKEILQRINKNQNEDLEVTRITEVPNYRKQ